MLLLSHPRLMSFQREWIKSLKSLGIEFILKGGKQLGESFLNFLSGFLIYDQD